ncbi:MAG: nucleoside diphosphate kinase regulator [Pirellulales bacterium]|nr:nucleoside diphosphate kinase regulator [Pirellulales bacterium]
MARKIIVTELDRTRLGTLLEKAVNVELVERRYLQDLSRELERAETVAPTDVPPDVITMNSTARVREIESGDVYDYTLVYPEQADVERQRISVLSPVGTALIGYRVGDVIEWPVPAGKVQLKVEEVLYQPEREGDFNR